MSEKHTASVSLLWFLFPFSSVAVLVGLVTSPSLCCCFSPFPPVLLFCSRQASSVWLFMVRQNYMFSGNGSLDRMQQQKHMDEGNGDIFSTQFNPKDIWRDLTVFPTLSVFSGWLFHLDFYRPEHIVHPQQSVQRGFMKKQILVK